MTDDERDTRVFGAERGGIERALAVPEEADALLVDVRTRREVVERGAPVPGEVRDRRGRVVAGRATDAAVVVAQHPDARAASARRR